MWSSIISSRTSLRTISARVIVRSNGSLVALDREGDVGARLAADLPDLVLHRRAVDALAVDRQDDVAGLQPGPVGGRIGQRRHDHQAARR